MSISNLTKKLLSLSKAELTVLANRLGLKNVSRLNKKDLATKIIENSDLEDIRAGLRKPHKSNTGAILWIIGIVVAFLLFYFQYTKPDNSLSKKEFTESLYPLGHTYSINKVKFKFNLPTFKSVYDQTISTKQYEWLINSTYTYEFDRPCVSLSKDLISNDFTEFLINNISGFTLIIADTLMETQDQITSSLEYEERLLDKGRQFTLGLLAKSSGKLPKSHNSKKSVDQSG